MSRRQEGAKANQGGRTSLLLQGDAAKVDEANTEARGARDLLQGIRVGDAPVLASDDGEMRRRRALVSERGMQAAGRGMRRE